MVRLVHFPKYFSNIKSVLVIFFSNRVTVVYINCDTSTINCNQSINFQYLICHSEIESFQGQYQSKTFQGINYNSTSISWKLNVISRKIHINYSVSITIANVDTVFFSKLNHIFNHLYTLFGLF